MSLFCLVNHLHVLSSDFVLVTELDTEKNQMKHPLEEFAICLDGQTHKQLSNKSLLWKLHELRDLDRGEGLLWALRRLQSKGKRL